MSSLKKNQMLAKLDPFESALADSFRRLHVENTSVILAVSGGADSVALLVGAVAVAARLKLTLAVVTIDHGFRPESGKETTLVEKLGQRLSVPVHVRRLKLEKGPALEARAREARYQCLEEVRLQLSFDLIATAHTGSDQAETVLMRLLRGSALGGTAAIREQRQHLVRPMLFAERLPLRSWLRSRRVKWLDDPMNVDDAFFRVRVRQKVLPTLSKAGGDGTVERLARFARFASQDDAFLSSLAETALQRVVRPDGRLDAIAVRHLALPIARRTVGRYLQQQGLEVDSGQIDAVLDVCVHGGRCTLKRDLTLTVRAGLATVERSAPRSTQNFTHSRRAK